ncbi:cytochrome P450 [Fusarium oxysporum Fo47]|uniref:cytochrome P450 n=1 Tax=Fusarium oxysporum Fo47 TaxID=660027 RepID=UPI002869DDEE|nr:cytochrome P450 [Fusarium oxysporum Fo47]QKD59202.2 cytochrome P450 [Fusarium oxysporum Fo47]
MITQSSPTELSYVGTTVVLFAVLLWWIISTLSSPLRPYPGSLFAKWTNLWRLYQVRTQKYQWTIQDLHKKYGPIIRIGPNLLDLDYPELIKIIYGTDHRWLKFYLNNSSIVDGKIKHNLFSTTSPAEHAQMKKPMAKYYSSSNVLTMEVKMNQVIEELCKQIDNRQPFGYMKKGHDFDGTIIASALSVDYFAQIGQMPFLDWLLNKNPMVRIGPPDISHVTHFSIAQLQRRLEQQEKHKSSDEPDFLDHFIGGMKSNPDSVNAKLVLNFLLANVLAGADTTAIALRAIFDFLLQNQHAMTKLKSEILTLSFNDAEAVPYSRARSLPYLDAVIRESLRMHPSVAMPLERYVPNTGLTLPDGSFIPPGVAVGLNPYIIGRNEVVWGEDTHRFRPDRWLKTEDESEGEYQRRLRKMNGADLTFGGGCSYIGVTV